MNIEFGSMTHDLRQVIDMQVMFTHLKLWVAVARHNSSG